MVFFIVQIQFDQVILRAHMSPHMNTDIYYYNTIRTSIYKSILNFSETRDPNVQSHENVVGLSYPLLLNYIHENDDCHFSKFGEYESLTQFHKFFVMCNLSPLFFCTDFTWGKFLITFVRCWFMVDLCNHSYLLVHQLLWVIPRSSTMELLWTWGFFPG